MRTCGTVMLVEDQDEIRQMLAEVLVSLGYEVQSAADGRDALAQLDPNSLPCVILLDLMMPHMNGWQVIEALRRDPSDARAKVPIVVITAVAEPHANALLRSVQGVFPKPLDLPNLLNVVEHYCGS